MHPACDSPDPIGRLIHVHDRRRAQHGDQRGDEPAKASCGVGVDRVDRAGRHADTEQVAHRFTASFDRDMLTTQQVHDPGSHARPVRDRGPHVLREHSGSRRPATGAQPGDRLMFGDDRDDRWEIDDLTAGNPDRRGVAEPATAPRTPLRRVLDRRVRRVGQRE